MKSLFKSQSAKEEILELYDKKLAELNIESESQFVNTSFGKTHLLVSGNPSNPPLIIIHGSNGCAPIALESYPNLTDKYQVFAVDVIAQPNKSDGATMSMKDDSYGNWMNEVITGLNLDNVVLVGFSFGGLIILKTLINDQSKIKEVFMASPVYIVNGNPLKALFKIFIPMKRYMSSKKPEYIEKFLSVLFTDRDEFAIQYLSKVFLNFEMDFTPIPIVKEREVKHITTPITLIAAQHDILFPGKKMINRAKKIFPSLKKSVLLEKSKHVQNKEGNRIVEQLILGG